MLVLVSVGTDRYCNKTSDQFCTLPHDVVPITGQEEKVFIETSQGQVGKGKHDRQLYRINFNSVLVVTSQDKQSHLLAEGPTSKCRQLT